MNIFMEKSYGQIELEFIDNLLPSTGKNLSEWLIIIRKENLAKRDEIASWLKNKHSFAHTNATMLASIYLNGGKPVYADENELLNNQFKQNDTLRMLYDFIISDIKASFPDCTIVPKKTYISITQGREFAAINVKKDELRLGFDLGDTPFTDELIKSKLTGPMPRISHMIILNNKNQVNENLRRYLALSKERSNAK